MNSSAFAVQNIQLLGRDYSLAISEHQGQLFNTYLEELWTWNQRKNLIGVSSPEKVVTELLLDSLIPAPFLPREGKLLDVGSGAGFPALPLKIYNPDLKVHLLEPNQKKVSFLRYVIHLLKLTGIEVIKSRIETEEPNLKAATYEIITTRALTDLSRTMLWSSPLLNPGNRLVCFLGPQGPEDLKKCEPELKNLGIETERVISYLLPGKTTKRHAVIFVKTILG